MRGEANHLFGVTGCFAGVEGLYGAKFCLAGCENDFRRRKSFSRIIWRNFAGAFLSLLFFLRISLTKMGATVCVGDLFLFFFFCLAFGLC
jgi:hypothetical protein